MTDEKNNQPDVENENQELSEEELNDVAGGMLALRGIQNPTLINNTFTGGVKPPEISGNLLDGIKGE